MANVLRYPYEALTDSTDYLQINLIERKFGSTNAPFSNLVEERSNGTSKFAPSSLNTVPVNLKSNQLVNQISQSVGVILLPMPSAINDTNQVSYSEDNLDAITAKIAGTASGLMNIPLFQGPGGTVDLTKFGQEAQIIIGKALSSGAASNVGALLKASFAAQAASLSGLSNLTLNTALARSSGQIVNPNVELLFNGPTIRNFRFSFKMTPRNSSEANQIKLIIRSLKKHMSPQLGNGEQVFLKAPNIFELKYKNGQNDNQYLNRFKQCALENMSVNYTGENVYATYEDGAPVSTILDLTFKELEPIYSADYNTPEGEIGVGY